MRAALLVAVLLAGCAEIPFCDVPKATQIQTPQGNYLLFDDENAGVLAELVRGTEAGSCKPRWVSAAEAELML